MKTGPAGWGRLGGWLLCFRWTSGYGCGSGERFGGRVRLFSAYPVSESGNPGWAGHRGTIGSLPGDQDDGFAWLSL